MTSNKRYALLLIGSESSQKEFDIFLSFNNIPPDLEILHYIISDELSHIEEVCVCGKMVKNIFGNLRATSEIIHFITHEVTDKQYIVYCHHDAFNLSFEAYQMIDDLLDTYSFENIGLAGFNIYHDEDELCKWDPSVSRYQTTCRTPFELGDAYYRDRPSSRVNYAKFIDNKAFEIAIPMWSTCLINVKTFKEVIPKTGNFDFFFSMDDIAVQFLKHNKINVCFPFISFGHQQSTKKYLNQVVKSPKAAGGTKYGRVDWMEKWHEIHGYRWNVRKYFYGLTISHYLFGRLGKTIQSLLSQLQTVSRHDITRANGAMLSDKELEFYKNKPETGPIAYVETL